MNEEELKLIYILKVGYNSKGEGLYEFIFSTDETNVDVEEWGWDDSPASNNAQPPTEDCIDKIISLKTSSFDLFCLHEAVDREYMHGYHTIHALAYELIPEDDDEPSDEDGFDGFEKLMDDPEDAPLLVFHYGMTLSQVKDLLYDRKIMLQEESFLEINSINI